MAEGRKVSSFNSLSSLVIFHLNCFISRWKEWSASRFTLYWGLFLDRKDANLDPQYNTIKSLYDTVANSAQRGNQEQPGTSKTTTQSSKKNQKATKKDKKKMKSEL